jgi:hypothetical protein
MLTKKLTVAAVKKAKPSDSIYRVHDEDHKGLYLQVTPQGSKSYLLRYRLGGLERFMGLGSAKDVTLAEARERARLFRQQIKEKIDPLAARTAERSRMAKEARDRVTFKEAVGEFLTVHNPTWRNKKHRNQWKSTLENYAIPKLGAYNVTEIEPEQITEVVTPIHAKAPETARRVRDRVERVIAWIKQGKPLPHRNGAKKDNHPAMRWQEVPRVSKWQSRYAALRSKSAVQRSVISRYFSWSRYARQTRRRLNEC